MGLRFAWLEPSSVRNAVMMNFVLIHPSPGRWCIDWIEVQMRFSSIVSFRGLIIFFIFFLILSFSILVSFLWFDFHSDIWKKFRVKFCIVFGSSLHLLIGFFLHFQRWDRSYLYEGYHSDNIHGVLRACHPNHHIQILPKWSSIFIGVYKDWQFRSISILGPL
jgi:hypothetical protein